nr:Sec-independent protein translocase component TatC [Calliblepharis sp.]
MCFIFCNFIIFCNLPLIFLIESYSFLKLYTSKFLLINITDLFDIIWYTCIQNSFLFSYIFFYYQLISFNKPGWYLYQHFFKDLLYKSSIFIILLFLLFYYFYYFHLILKFLTQWDIIYFKDILNIEFELSLLNYVKWLFWVKIYFGFLFYLVFLIIFKMFYLIYKKTLYIIFKFYKNQILFFIITFLFLLSPSEAYIQFLLLIISFLLVEFLFFFICFIIINSNSIHANNSTIIKKT